MNGVSFTLSLPLTSAGAGNQISTSVTLVYHGNKVSEPAKAFIRDTGRQKRLSHLSVRCLFHLTSRSLKGAVHLRMKVL